MSSQVERFELLVDAARTLFIAKGFQRVGMREIAALAGLSPVQAYRIGLAKEDLLAEISIRLTAEQLATITANCHIQVNETLQAFTERYLQLLYESDIQNINIRKESAAYGWMWSAKYEARIIEQVMALLQPIASAMAAHGLENIPARGLGIWSLYYVGYRLAVMHGATADECLGGIRDSLTFLLK